MAAVGTLVADKRGIGRIANHGAVWGLGHSLTLAAFGGVVFAFRFSIDEALAGALELLVGVMLILLGGRLLHRLIRGRVHFHFHRHRDGTHHIHAHSHHGDTLSHAASHHEHGHPPSHWRRTFAVGVMHGLAGSAAIVALTAATADSVLPGLLFILVFGAGSITGMALLSMAIAIPLSFTAASLSWLRRLFEAGAGGLACVLGAILVQANTPALASLLRGG